MRWSLLTLVVALVLAASSARAHTIDLDAGAKECFFEDLHTEDKVRLPSLSASSSPSPAHSLSPTSLLPLAPR